MGWRTGKLAILLLCACVHGCGGAELGESCDEVGSGDECVDDALCTNEDEGAAACRALCDEQADCPDTQDCNGVSNSNLKTCQPKKD